MASTRLPNLNRVMIVGNLTRDPDLRATTAGVPVINFRIASNRRFKDNSGEWREDVCYVGVVAWQKLAESCADRLRKGSAVYIEGELRSRTFDNGDGTKRNLIKHLQHRPRAKAKPVLAEPHFQSFDQIVDHRLTFIPRRSQLRQMHRLRIAFLYRWLIVRCQCPAMLLSTLHQRA